MKVCSKCGEEKEESEFNMHVRKLRNSCKDCDHAACKITRDIYREAKRKFVRDYKTSNGCASCGDKRPYVLDFHHIDPSTKTGEVSALITSGSNMKRLVLEIDKCIVLCSNCHRELHHYERLVKGD